VTIRNESAPRPAVDVWPGSSSENETSKAGTAESWSLSALVVSFIVFACVLGGAVLGMFTRSLLPDHHVNEDSKYIFKLGIGLIATLAALVLGLLIASAKGSYDAKQDEVKQGAAKIILLDRTLRHYGPDADPARAILRCLSASKTALTWMKSDMDVGVRPGDVSPGIEEVQEKLRVLVPASEGQRWLQTRGLELSSELAQMRWLSIDQHGGSIPAPFLVALVFWLAVIFCSFGLFAPRHLTVYAVLFACALSVSSAIFLILELDRPFEGLLAISDVSLRDAIAELNR
jgi:hypothetical protein